MDRKWNSPPDLCRSCHRREPKYRCPRCKARTCSLPCYKVHQQRATCNGKRNPAAYQKQSQLLKPASIDQDYNYLKGVERELDHASKETLERGICNEAANSKVFNRGMHPESSFQQYLTTNRIHVNRAPLGMNRQQTNNTRSSNRGNIIWTVEWIDDDGSRELRDSPDTETLVELYSVVRLKKINAAKRKLAAQDSLLIKSDISPKRRRASNSNPATDSTVEPTSKVETNTGADDDIETKLHEQHTSNEDVPEQVSKGEEAVDASSDPQPDHQKSQPQPTPEQPTPGTRALRLRDLVLDGLFFYLHKANVRSPSKVLIPLPPTTPLTEALKDREVNEYPTLYVLSHPPDSLPEGFVTEEKFLTLPVIEESTKRLKREGPRTVEEKEEFIKQVMESRRLSRMKASGYPVR